MERKQLRATQSGTGLLSRQIANNSLEEKIEDFRKLHEALIEEHKPVGLTEHLWVERIAACWFRLGRIVPAESGHLNGGVLSCVSKLDPLEKSDSDWTSSTGLRHTQRRRQESGSHYGRETELAF
jgi:hypothetical protein